MRKFILMAGIISCTTWVWAQQIVPCATDEVYVEMTRKFPELKQEEEKANQIAATYVNLQKKGVIRYFPVVFHVIHKWGMENISQAQLNDAIRVLNEDFRKAAGTKGGSSTDPLSIDMEYEFRLAQFDPNGQPTNGVNRIYSTGTDNAQDQQKALSYWDSKKYFNVWIVNTIYNGGSGTILGYAQFPFQINQYGSTDGVMLRADQAGVIDLGSTGQSGRTLTHEAGHWVGLYHPFQGGCVGNTPSNCSSQGDQVCDTPPVSTSTNGCPGTRNSCTNDSPDLPDQIRNYMDYADGNCMNIYTPGQKTRSSSLLNSYRSIAFSAANLSAIGLNADGTYKNLTASATKAPYSFGFNVASLWSTGWTIENYMSPGDSGWAVNNLVSVQGTGCMSAQNIKNNRLNIRNAFISPNIDITTLAAPTLSFYLAYAKRLTVSGDRLRIYISNNYGRTELLVREILAAEMETGTMSANAFTPGTGEWKKFNIDLTPYKSYTNCRIKFELKSLKGNNIFIDEFSISTPTSVEELLKQSLQFAFYPNPAHNRATVSITNSEEQTLEMSVADISGRLVIQMPTQNLETGTHQVEIPLGDLQSGMYLLQVKTPKGTFNHKFLIN
ncbi:MAG: M43 family zinc metalloprotease [Bacteroidota bacterium]|nr:M43 family zinc metalloprotease [Bacteroidota bacterium]